GLVATHIDSAKVEVVRLEPTVALAYKAGESGHPRLDAAAGTASWEGFVNVVRPGAYRFKANLRGKVVVMLDGKQVLSGDIQTEAAALIEGPELKFDAGVLPLKVTFSRSQGPARLELLWQGPNFHLEPLPHDYVGHVPAQDPKKLREAG